MQFKTATALASLVAAVSALPALPAAANGTAAGLPADAKFQLMAIRSASEIQYAPFQAAQSSVFLRLPSQGASCDQQPSANGTAADAATFYLSQDGGLYLYAASATPQQLYADRSGMGQGKLGYTTGAEPAPRNAERVGWAVDSFGDLTLDGAAFVACPGSADGAWSVWVSAGVANPAGNTGCLGIAVRAVPIAAPNSCSYTQ